jgi:hypothetical protein
VHSGPELELPHRPALMMRTGTLICIGIRTLSRFPPSALLAGPARN